MYMYKKDFWFGGEEEAATELYYNAHTGNEEKDNKK